MKIDDSGIVGEIEELKKRRAELDEMIFKIDNKLKMESFNKLLETFKNDEVLISFVNYPEHKEVYKAKFVKIVID